MREETWNWVDDSNRSEFVIVHDVTIDAYLLNDILRDLDSEPPVTNPTLVSNVLTLLTPNKEDQSEFPSYAVKALSAFCLSLITGLLLKRLSKDS